MIENYAEKIKHESNGFIRHNGIRIVSVDEERSVLKAEITENSRNVWGSVHGGFLYTMADTAAGAFAAHQVRAAQCHAQRLDELPAAHHAQQDADGGRARDQGRRTRWFF